MKTPIKLNFVLFTLFFALSCSKNSCSNSKNGVLKNFTGLDGCDWVIVLDDGKKLEPSNLSEYKIGLSEGKKVSIRYSPIKNTYTACMVGEFVEIKCMKER
jgi:hypothetical protein